MRTLFDEQLNQLHVELTRMGHCVEKAIEKMIDAFEQHDLILANEIIANDELINEMQRSIENKALSLMLLQQPIASDLRYVTAALKVVTDLERIGDHAADIASILLQINQKHAFHMIEVLPTMAKKTKKMVWDAVEAFIENDGERACQIKQKDDEVDALFQRIKEIVGNLLKDEKETVDCCLELLMIAKYLERMCDHAVNICEWLEFSEKGSVNNQRLI